MPAALDRRIQMGDLHALPVDGCSGILQLSVHSVHDALHEVKVSQVPVRTGMNGIGEIVAPVSRSRIARIFVTNAAAPTAFVKLIP